MTGRHPNEGLTVRELVEALRVLPEGSPVVALYDCGCAEGTVVGLEIYPADGHDDSGASAVIVID